MFVGWTAFNLLFVVGTLVLAREPARDVAPLPRDRLRDAGGRARPPAIRSRTGHDIADPLSLVRPGLEALSFYWAFLAGLGVLAWIILYLA